LREKTRGVQEGRASDREHPFAADDKTNKEKKTKKNKKKLDC